MPHFQSTGSSLRLRILAPVFAATFFGGCASNVPTPENTAWTNLVNSMSSERSDTTASVPLSPATWYLKVQVPGTPPALLVFGYLESHTTPPTEVWFSGGGQFIKIQSGRVVGTYGLPVNWQDVAASPDWPEWSAMSNSGRAYTRTRSDLSVYEVGIREQMRLTPVAAPGKPISTIMPGATDSKSANWRWYQEEVISGQGTQPLPPALFATATLQGSTFVAFSHQCLSESFCLRIMRWPQLESTPQQ